MFQHKRVQKWDDFAVGDLISYRASQDPAPTYAVVLEKAELQTKIQVNEQGDTEPMRVVVVVCDGNKRILRWSDMQWGLQVEVAFARDELLHYYGKGGK